MKEKETKSKSQLLDEREKVNRDYWGLKIKTEEQYRKAKKEKDKYVGMRSKLGKMSNKIMELIKEYEGKE